MSDDPRHEKAPDSLRAGQTTNWQKTMDLRIMDGILEQRVTSMDFHGESKWVPVPMFRSAEK